MPSKNYVVDIHSMSDDRQAEYIDIPCYPIHKELLAALGSITFQFSSHAVDLAQQHMRCRMHMPEERVQLWALWAQCYVIEAVTPTKKNPFWVHPKS